MESKNNDDKSIDYSYQSYRDYSNNLRVWYMAFGFGLPTFILADSELLKFLRESGSLATLIWLIGVGVVSQVLLTILNKRINWYCYKFQSDHEYCEKNPHKFKFYSELSNHFWIDTTLDFITLGCFGYSLWIFLSGLKL